MKSIVSLLLLCFSASALFAQVSGNINYQNQIRFPDSHINLGFPSQREHHISVKGLANVKADSYVAIFHLIQTGKTTDEVNQLIDERINNALALVKASAEVATYVDMISFVPVYNYQVDKKLFSKKTYNEIPVGFELQKNIHVQYTDPEALNTIISSLAKMEIYDLVRVDYFSSKMDSIKAELMSQARALLEKKMKNYEGILSVNMDTLNKQLVDGYKVVFPVEMYKSYQSYNSSMLHLKKSANVQQASKTNTLYYQPVLNKEFDFVLNPVIMEPVIQVMYELKLKTIEYPVSLNKPTKEYMLITPDGTVKSLNLK